MPGHDKGQVNVTPYESPGVLIDQTRGLRKSTSPFCLCLTALIREQLYRQNLSRSLRESPMSDGLKWEPAHGVGNEIQAESIRSCLALTKE